MTASPIPVALPPPIAVTHYPARIFTIQAGAKDDYDRRPPVAVKVFDARPGSTAVRVGIRQGDRRSEAVLTAAQLRQIAEHLHDCADLIDPEGAET